MTALASTQRAVPITGSFAFERSRTVLSTLRLDARLRSTRQPLSFRPEGL